MAVSLEHWDGTIRQPFHDYGLDGGPYLNNGAIKLYVDNQTLLAIPSTDLINDPRLFTRDTAYARHLLEITAPSTWQLGDPLVFVERDV